MSTPWFVDPRVDRHVDHAFDLPRSVRRFLRMRSAARRHFDLFENPPHGAPSHAARARHDQQED